MNEMEGQKIDRLENLLRDVHDVIAMGVWPSDGLMDRIREAMARGNK